MSECLGSGVASGVTKMMLSSESELDALSMCESSSAKGVVDYVVRRPCTGLDKVCNTVKDEPWGTEVFRGLGCNPDIVGLHPKGWRVQCAIEAHRARGRRATKSNTDVNGEDVSRRSEVRYPIRVTSNPEGFPRLRLAIRGDSESELLYRRGQGSTRVLTMMAGAQPGGLAMYQVKVREPRRGTEA
ncbi:hypothetical protein BKA62DRAFT_672931 [Auriculariales sp. MPI-PUGE-AT-0066]|nr:hypothetical protein BKA62DRAFT_672931 [Auriculariales sp. MPI-PUGE-AT-0066]